MCRKKNGELMLTMTMDIPRSAQLLGIESETLAKFIAGKKIPGVLQFGDAQRISLFTLAEWLNTDSYKLFDLLEDDVMGGLIEEVMGDDVTSGADSKQLYQQFLAEMTA